MLNTLKTCISSNVVNDDGIAADFCNACFSRGTIF